MLYRKMLELLRREMQLLQYQIDAMKEKEKVLIQWEKDEEDRLRYDPKPKPKDTPQRCS